MKDLRIEKAKVSSLKEYEGNAKIHTQEQIEQIKRSIQEFGFNDPVGIWKDTIVEGHGRVIAAKQLGMDEVPVIRLDHMTDEQRRAYTLVHNKLTMNTDFDFSKLDEELDALKDIDMSMFGFDVDIDIEAEEPRPIIEDDFTEDVPTRSSYGQVWILGNHRLMCGDSTKEKDVKRLMKNELADMVFTDPPWNVNYGQDNGTWKQRSILNDSMTTEDFKEFMYSAFKCLNNASKAGAMTYIVMSAQEWGNMMLALRDNEYHWSSTIIWNKDQLVLSRKDYHTRYEPIWYGWKDGAPRLCPLEDRKQCDVWDIARPKRSDEHPTMKPVELVARAITNSSHQEDIVLDLFGGSGTTLIAAEQTKRNCRMMELDPHYCDVIIERWENLTGEKAIVAEGLF